MNYDRAHKCITRRPLRVGSLFFFFPNFFYKGISFCMVVGLLSMSMHGYSIQ